MNGIHWLARVYSVSDETVDYPLDSSQVSGGGIIGIRSLMLF